MTSAAAAAEEDAASASRRRGRGRLGWAAALCFESHGARREQEAVASSSRARRRRTVPVDGELVPRPAVREARRGEDEEIGYGPRARGCCCLPLAPRVPAGRKDDTTRGSDGGGTNVNRKRRQQARPQPQDHHQNPACQVPHPQQTHQPGVAPAAEPETGGTSAAEPRAPTRVPTPARDAATKNGASTRVFRGAFGPAVGLSVVAAVSMAGLLGGRVWAVACVCAWLAALSRLRPRRRAQVSAGGVAIGSDVAEVVVVD